MAARTGTLENASSFLGHVIGVGKGGRLREKDTSSSSSSSSGITWRGLLSSRGKVSPTPVERGLKIFSNLNATSQVQ